MSATSYRDFWITLLAIYVMSFLVTCSIWPDQAAHRVAAFVKAYNLEMAK